MLIVMYFVCTFSLVLIAYAKTTSLNTYADVSSGTKYLMFSLRLQPHSYIEYVRGEARVRFHMCRHSKNYLIADGIRIKISCAGSCISVVTLF